MFTSFELLKNPKAVSKLSADDYILLKFTPDQKDMWRPMYHPVAGTPTFRREEVIVLFTLVFELLLSIPKHSCIHTEQLTNDPSTHATSSLGCPSCISIYRPNGLDQFKRV